MSIGKVVLVGILGAVLTACASSSPEAGMTQVSGYSKEHAINAPLSAAILRRVKEITPEDAAPAIALPGPGPMQAQASLTVAQPVAAQAATVAPAAALQPAAVTAAPAPVAPAASAPAEPSPPPAERWVMDFSDGSMSRALKRWAERAGVPLVWEAPKDKPAFRAAYLGTFDEAIERVMFDTRHSEYRVHACGFDNVVVILHESQSCKR